MYCPSYDMTVVKRYGFSNKSYDFRCADCHDEKTLRWKDAITKRCSCEGVYVPMYLWPDSNRSKPDDAPPNGRVPWTKTDVIDKVLRYKPPVEATPFHEKVIGFIKLFLEIKERRTVEEMKSRNSYKGL